MHCQAADFLYIGPRAWASGLRGTRRSSLPTPVPPFCCPHRIVRPSAHNGVPNLNGPVFGKPRPFRHVLLRLFGKRTSCTRPAGLTCNMLKRYCTRFPFLHKYLQVKGERGLSQTHPLIFLLNKTAAF